MAGGSYNYNAFISYSHAADDRLAPALQSALQRFAKPLLQARGVRVFRDETGLGLTPALWPAIEQALSESEYFILLASPQAAASEWVRKEINWWLQHRDVEHLLLACTDGDLPWDGSGRATASGTRFALPPELTNALGSEPKYCNLRFARTSLDLSLRNPHFLYAVAQLSAVLRGRPLDELVDKEVRLNRRVHFLIRSTIAVLAGLVLLALTAASLAWYQRGVATRQRTIAEEQREISRKRLVEVMVNNGVRHWRDNEYAESLLWFIEALKQEPENSPSAQLQRLRIASTIRQQPALRHVWLENQRPPGERAPIHFSQDSRLLLSQSPPGLRVWDIETGKLVFEFGDREGIVLADLLSGANPPQFLSISENEAQIRQIPSGAELQTFDHPSPVEDAAFALDGSKIATICEDGKIRVWETRSGQELVVLESSDTPLGVRFSSNGKRILTSHPENGLTVWDLETREGVPIRNKKAVWPTLSTDGERLMMTVKEDATTTLWDTNTGEQTSSLGDWQWVDFACFSPDGKTVLQVLRGGSVELRNIEDESNPITVHVAGNAIHAAFSGDGKRFATGDTANSVRIWNPATGKLLHSPLMHEDTVSHVDFDPTGTRLVTRTADDVIRVWELTNRAPLLRVKHRESVKSAVFNRNQSLLLTTTSFGARITDIKTQQSVNLGITSQLYSAEFNEDGTLVVTGTERGEVAIWEAKSGQLLKSFPQESRVKSAKFIPGGKKLLTASGGQLRVLDADTGKVTRSFEYDTPIGGIQLSSDGTLAAGVSFHRIAHVWDLAGGNELAGLRRTSVLIAALSADGAKVAYASESDFSLEVMDVRTAKSISRTAPVGRANSLTFSPDGSRLAASDNSSASARVWDVATGGAVTPPLQHGNRVHHVEFSPDGKAVVTASSDETARVWDALTGTPLTPPFEHNEVVGTAEFSHDGSRLATASGDNSAIVWDLSPAEGSIPQLQYAAQLLAAQRLDPTGSFVKIPSAEFIRLWTGRTNTPPGVAKISEP